MLPKRLNLLELSTLLWISAEFFGLIRLYDVYKEISIVLCWQSGRKELKVKKRPLPARLCRALRGSLSRCREKTTRLWRDKKEKLRRRERNRLRNDYECMEYKQLHINLFMRLIVAHCAIGAMLFKKLQTHIFLISASMYKRRIFIILPYYNRFIPVFLSFHRQMQ